MREKETSEIIVILSIDERLGSTSNWLLYTGITSYRCQTVESDQKSSENVLAICWC